MPDPYLKNWLLDTGSLTERLMAMSQTFDLIKLGQGDHPLHAQEQRWLGDGNWQVREVYLCGNGQNWVFARSVLPMSLVEGELNNLGQQPLGKRLFNDSRFVRSEFELCELTPAQVQHLCETLPSHKLWGRRSRFTFEGQSMIVAELFLPDSPAYQNGYQYGNALKTE